MSPTSLQQVARWADGQTGGDASCMISGVSTDSRSIKTGDLFIALRGDKFDGHQFLETVYKSGAAAVMVDSQNGMPAGNANAVLLGDTLKGLQSLAGGYRRSLALKMVCVTGSNGKTSTKDMTAALLGQRFKVCKTEGNFNNHIGLPLTLLRANASHQVQIAEIGMNHPGEIAPLASLARPDIAIITNVGVAHIEFMKTREAIALEKGMLAEAVDASGVVILNAEDEFTSSIASRTSAKVVTVGFDAGDVRATNVEQLASGMKFTLHANGRSVPAQIPMLGEHMVRNALLAVACGIALGMTLEECVGGLNQNQLTKGRLTQKEVRGIQILHDTYNANPDSMSAAIITLARMPVTGRRFAVLGRMGELGVEAETGHRRVGEIAGREKITHLVAVGQEAEWIADSAVQAGASKVTCVKTNDEASELLLTLAKAGDAILVKGSRSAKMEQIIQALEGGKV